MYSFRFVLFGGKSKFAKITLSAVPNEENIRKTRFIRGFDGEYEFFAINKNEIRWINMSGKGFSPVN